MEDSYYECGDHTILVLKILNSHTGQLFVCLGYSTSHGDYNLETLTESHFNEFYAHNKMTGGYEYDNLSYKGLTGL